MEVFIEVAPWIGLILFAAQSLHNEYRNHLKHLAHRDAINGLISVVQETDEHEFDRKVAECRVNYHSQFKTEESANE